MNITELVEYLVKSIVSKPDMVSVKQFDEEDSSVIEVIVDESDMGAVIGKNGKIAQSIRTIAKSAAYTNGLKKVNINFDTF